MSEAEARAPRFLIRYAGQVRVRAIERPDRSLRAHSRRGRDTTCRSERRLLLVASAKTALFEPLMASLKASASKAELGGPAGPARSRLRPA